MKHPKYYITDEATSKRMSNVKLKRGNAETILAKALWNYGYRYRLNDRKLPGSPDIAIYKYKIAIFVDGEFWHGYDWEQKKQRIQRNREYWIEKIEENMLRDINNDRKLKSLGWIPIHFWTKEILKDSDRCVQAIAEAVFENTVNNL